MPIVHVVDEGDHVSSIAELYGFENFETIWNAPENDALRARRDNPSTLLPGDEVLVPDKWAPEMKRPSAATHRFTIHVQKLVLRLRVLDWFGSPVANEKGKLTVEGRTLDVTSDGDGVVETLIARDACQGRIELGDHAFDLAIGALHPADEDSGIAQRLGNLGYPTGDEDDDSVDRDERVRFAIELFQSDCKRKIDGEMAPALLDELVKVHGT